VPRLRATPTAIATVLAGVLVLAGLVLAAQAIEPAQRPSFGPPSGSGRPSGAAAATPRSPSTPKPAAEITLAFGGDVHFEGRVAARLADPASTFGPIAGVLSRADLAMVNLETAITERGTPEPKSFYFRAPRTAFAALREAGIDVTSMANNHGADFGLVGLQDTFAAIEDTGFPVVGIGPDAPRAYDPWYAEVKGHRVAVIGVSQVPDHTLAVWTARADRPGIASANSDRLIVAIREARRRAEIVVVYVHWGVERERCPVGDQRALAQRLAAAGADAIVGTHAHRLQGAGWLGRTYVAYGLGNFLWWRSGLNGDDTGVLTLTFRARRAVAADFTPARIDDRGVPVPAAGEEARRIQDSWESARDCTDLAARPGG
jgi:poly-gamma-glutamate capsule biosynthesis protein CapA/YwtB (metallophosphatase superfamily)